VVKIRIWPFGLFQSVRTGPETKNGFTTASNDLGEQIAIIPGGSADLGALKGSGRHCSHGLGRGNFREEGGEGGGRDDRVTIKATMAESGGYRRTRTRTSNGGGVVVRNSFADGTSSM
jgi:hypothetical protein